MSNILLDDSESDDDVLDEVNVRKSRKARGRRVLFDDDSDEETEVSEEEAEESSVSFDDDDAPNKPTAPNVDRSARYASMTDESGIRPTTPVIALDDADDLVEGMQELKLSRYANSPTCSLQNVSVDSKTHNLSSHTMIAIDSDSGDDEMDGSAVTLLKTPEKAEFDEHGVAWTFDEDQDEYYLSNCGRTCKPNDHMVCSEWPACRIPRELYERLYDHQVSGVQWLAAVHARRTGGILGDDMGLGKTYQTVTLLGGLMRARSIRNALVLCPVSLLRTWENEARAVIKTFCVPSVTICVVSSETAKGKRTHLLRQALTCSSKRPHLVISTYGLLASNPLDLTPEDYDGNRTHWDYVILDEGHKIKNHSTKTNRGCHQICRSPRTRRLLLTGTPIMNNLAELWALFDWATSGSLLGKRPNFTNRYAEPIQQGRDKNATIHTLKIAEKANKELQEKLRPCFLQRLKKDVFATKLPKKRDLVVWTHLSDEQRAMYEKFVTVGDEVYMLLNGEKSSPLEAITYLKKLCGHPILVSKRFGDGSRPELLEKPESLLHQSQKLQTLVALIGVLKKAGHRTLIFSQSTRMLDIIERVLYGVSMSRIDGSTKERDRQRLVDEFNSADSKCCCMLLSTKAGGLGLTLTGADRAVIFDPSWNPAEDSQAVDRCYRIGTSKPVTIYRLIASGTVEERMYEKQVFKDGLRRTLLNTSGVATDRYFTKNELRRMFTLSPAGECEMLERVRVLNNGRPSSPAGRLGTLTFLENHPSVVGVSSHDALYTETMVIDDSRDKKKTFQSPFAGGAPFGKVRVPALNVEMVQSDVEENYIPLGQDVPNRTRGGRENARKNKKLMGEQKQNIIDLENDEGASSELPSAALKEELALEDEIENLMDSLQSSDSQARSEKLALHKKIAYIARDLGWL